MANEKVVKKVIAKRVDEIPLKYKARLYYSSPNYVVKLKGKIIYRTSKRGKADNIMEFIKKYRKNEIDLKEDKNEKSKKKA